MPFSEFTFNGYSGCYLIQTAGTWNQCSSFCSINNGSMVNLETMSEFDLIMSILNSAPNNWFWVNNKIIHFIIFLFIIIFFVKTGAMLMDQTGDSNFQWQWSNPNHTVLSSTSPM
jgi:hypothetical protein